MIALTLPDRSINVCDGLRVKHFAEVIWATDVEAALAAGIFHLEEVPIEGVKKHLQEEGIEIR